MSFDKIFPSKDQIRLEIIKYFKQNLELENDDFDKSSFLSHIINVMTDLYSNSLFQNNLQTRENNFLTQKIKRNVKNIQKMLGYEFNQQSSQKGKVTFRLDFSSQLAKYNEFNVVIPSVKSLTDSQLKDKNIDLNDLEEFYKYDNYYVYKGNIPYIVEDYINIKYKNNQFYITKQNKNNFEYESVDFSYGLDSSNNINRNVIIFDIDVTQYKINQQKYVINNIESLYKIPIYTKTKDKYIFDIELYQKDNITENIIKWDQYEYFDNMTQQTNGFIIDENEEEIFIQFGNGNYGKLPNNDDIFYVVYKETYGENGQQLPFEITNQDQISFQKDNIFESIGVQVQNTNQIIGGKNEDTIEEIKIKTFNKLKNNKMLLSEDDFKNLKLYYNSLFDVSEGFLEKNDINNTKVQIYNTLKYNGQIIPLYSLNLKIPYKELSLYRPNLKQLNIVDNRIIDKDYNQLNKEYRLLFDMNINSNFINTDYIIQKNNITQSTSEIGVIDNNLLKITGININKKDDKYEFILFTNKMNDINLSSYNFTLYLSQMDVSRTIKIENLTNKSTIQEEPLLLSFELDSKEIPIGQLNLNIYIENENVYQFNSTFTILKSLNNKMTSYTERVTELDEFIKIYQVPQIDKDYYDNLSDLDKNNILSLIYNEIENFDISDKTIYDINLKFQNTNGEIYALKYNKPDYEVIDIIDKNYVPTDVNDRSYLILYNEIYTEDSPLYNHLNDVITIKNDSFEYLSPKENDIVKIVNKNILFIFDGITWRRINIKNPIEIELDVWSLYTDNYVIENLKDLIYNSFVNKFGLNKNIYKQDIIKQVLELEYVKNVKIKKPYIDIIFDKLEDINKYSKQYIYFNKDDIKINLYKQT